MFCTRCGTKIEDENAKVCPNCNESLEDEVAEAPAQQPEAPQAPVAPVVHPEGPKVVRKKEKAEPAAPQLNPQPPVAEPAAPQLNPQPAAPVQPAAPKEKKPLTKQKWFIPALCGLAALLVVIIIVVVIILQPKKVNVDEYVSIEYYGYDGYATAEAYLDEYGLYYAILDAKGMDYNDISSMMDYSTWDDSASIAACIDTIDLTLNKTENVANGDELVVTITYDNELAKGQKIKFVGETVTITAGGLEPVAEIDPFEGLEVTFSGTAPYGYVNYEYTGSSPYVDSWYFNVSQYDGLKNGDIVTVTYDVTDESTLYDGYVATVKTMDYEVTGLEEYADCYADLPVDFIDDLKDEAEDTVYAYTASYYDSDTTLSGLEYAGYIMNCANDPINNYYWYTNSIHIIYKGTVSNSDGDFSDTVVYYPVCFRDILLQGDSISYSYKDGIDGYSYIDGSWTSTDGYVNPLTLYMELAEANSLEYNIECGDGFEVYADYTMIETLADISDDYKATLQADAKTRIENYVADDYNSDNTISGLAVVGEYLLIAKEQGSDFSYNNKYIVVYSAAVSNKNNRFPATTVYFPVLYEGVVALPDGEFMRMSCEGIQGYNRIGDSYYYTDGYCDGTKMFSDLVTVNREYYTYEVSAGLQQFGK